MHPTAFEADGAAIGPLVAVRSPAESAGGGVLYINGRLGLAVLAATFVGLRDSSDAAAQADQEPASDSAAW